MRASHRREGQGLAATIGSPLAARVVAESKVTLLTATLKISTSDAPIVRPDANALSG